MNQEELYQLIDNIPVTPENSGIIQEIKEDLERKDYASALEKIQMLRQKKPQLRKTNKIEELPETEEIDEENETQELEKKEETLKEGIFPKPLSNKELERQYIGLLLTDPRYIIKYFYLYEECYFEDEELLNIYKSVIFTEGRSLHQ